jgi:pSer/pThr/pTyr-binding forkhead associated (FHA) protein
MAGAREVASFGVRYLNDAAAFRRALRHPVLVWESPPEAKEEPLLFATRPGYGVVRPAPGRSVFFDVAKSAKNAFVDEVTLGRTANNDITVEENTVSRFHAYLAPSPEGKWSLVDAKSSSGTYVRGVKLEPRQPQALQNEERFRVGDVELLFLEPEGFWQYLMKLIGRRK